MTAPRLVVARRPKLPPVFHSRDFRLLLSGRVVSTLGEFAFPVALAFAIIDMTGSATSLGIVLGSRAAAFALSVVTGGVIADRMPRKMVLIGSDIVRTLAQSVLAAVVLTGVAGLWHFVVLGIVTGIAQGFFFPAWTGFLPSLVDKKDVKDANAVTSLSNGITEIAGPVLGGVILVVASPGAAIAVNAATFAVSAILLSFMKKESRSPSPAKTTILSDLVVGWTSFRSRAWVWSLTIAFAIANALYAITLVLGPVTAARDLGGAATWATVLAAVGVGSISGGLIALKIEPRRPLLASLAALLGLALLPLALGLSAPVPVLAACAVVSGAGIVVTNIYWYAALQRNIPSDVLSRVTSYDWLGSWIAMPIGYAVAGSVSAALGPRTSLITVAVATIVVGCVPAAIPAVRSLRTESTARREA